MRLISFSSPLAHIPYKKWSPVQINVCRRHSDDLGFKYLENYKTNLLVHQTIVQCLCEFDTILICHERELPLTRIVIKGRLSTFYEKLLL